MASTDDHWLPARHLLERLELRDEFDGLLTSLIPVLDSFDRLRTHTGGGKPADDPEALLATFERIGDQLRAAVADIGMVAFGAKGDPVDLGRYRVLDARQCGDVPEDTVVEVVRPGYQKDGRIFRSAEVIVAEQPKESQA